MRRRAFDGDAEVESMRQRDGSGLPAFNGWLSGVVSEGATGAEHQRWTCVELAAVAESVTSRPAWRFHYQHRTYHTRIHSATPPRQDPAPWVGPGT